MKKISMIALAALLACPITVARAASDASDDAGATNPKIKFPHGLQLGIGVSGASGLNGFVGYANKNFDSFWLKRFGIRFDFASTSPIKSTMDSAFDAAIGKKGVDIGDKLTVKDLELKAHHMAAIIDFYPFGNTWFLGGWRISGGYYMGRATADAALAGNVKGAPDTKRSFDLAETQYQYTGNSMGAVAQAKWNYRGPYVGTGFDFGLGAEVKIYADAGLVFTNRAAQLGLDVSTDNLQTWDGANWISVDTPEAIAALDANKQAALSDVQDKLDDMKFYPMVKIGLMYRF